VLSRTPFFFGLALLTGCSGQPDSYAPPIQRRPIYVPSDHGSLGYFVDMSDAGADAYIVRDISSTTENGGWRWTYRSPELRFYVPKAAGLKFRMDFAVPDRIFHSTGPITLTFRMNGKPFDVLRVDKGGEQQYLKEVPPGLIVPETANTVAIAPDKVWTSEQDGATLGFVLMRAGFTE
jgi:hypothetical protein